MREQELSRDEFYAALAGISKAVDSGFAGVHTRLDRLNGQTREHGQDIAVLKDRSRREQTAERKSRVKEGAIGGAVVTAVGALLEIARHYLSK